MIKILDTLHKRTQLLSFGIVFDSTNRLGVSVESQEPSIFLLSSDSGYDARDLTQLPDTAYSLAKRAYKPDEDGKNISLQAD